MVLRAQYIFLLRYMFINKTSGSDEHPGPVVGLGNATLPQRGTLVRFAAPHVFSDALGTCHRQGAADLDGYRLMPPTLNVMADDFRLKTSYLKRFRLMVQG